MTKQNLTLRSEEPVKLIVNRRAIAAGLTALIAVPATELRQLSKVPLSFNGDDLAMQMRDGLFKPDYRFPRVRLVFSDESYTAWNTYSGHSPGVGCRKEYITGGGMTRTIGSTPSYLEVCCPDKNGMPRYAQLAIG